MARWSELEKAEPEFAARVRERFDAHRHKTMATIRKDGSPRISGTELAISDGNASLGMMPDSVKLRDVLRDPRVAIHSATADPDDDNPSAWPGEAKLAGTLISRDAPDQGPEGSHFDVDLTEVVFTRVGEPADHLVIESWHPDRGLLSIKRV